MIHYHVGVGWGNRHNSTHQEFWELQILECTGVRERKAAEGDAANPVLFYMNTANELSLGRRRREGVII